MIGRAAELQALRSVLESARQGNGGCVLVSGEAGIGKTTLVRALVRDSDCRALWVYASDTSTPPYGLVESLARSLLDADSGILDACENHVEAMAVVLPDLGRRREGDGPNTIEKGIGCFLQAASKDRLLVWILEDLQWADSATIELLPLIDDAIAHAPVVILGIYRDDEVPRGHALRRMRNALRRKGRVTEVELGLLPERETGTLLREIIGGEPTDALVRVIHERTDGLPFFTEELIQMLVEEEGLIGGDNGYGWEPSGELPLPATIRDAVLLRLDRLSVSARRLLEACSVLGVAFDWGDALFLAGSDEALGELVASGTVVERNEGMGAFRHALVRDIVYEETLWTLRRDMHRKAASRFDAAHANKSVVAWHWLKGRELDRAREAYASSAFESCRIHAHRDAYQAGVSALELWPEHVAPSDRLELLDRLGECAQVSGLLPEASRAWKEAASYREAAGEVEAYARTLSRLATSYGLQGAWSQAMEARQLASRSFTDARLHGESAEERLMLSAHLHSAGTFSAALEVLVGAEEEAKRADRGDLAARILGLRGATLAKLGEAIEGRELIRRGLELALRNNHNAAAAEIYQRLASAIEQASDYEAAEEAYVAARTFCEAQGAHGAVQFCNACVAGVLWQRGEWQRTIAVCEDVIENATTSPMVRAVAAGFFGVVLVFRGEAAKSRHFLLEALTMARANEVVALELVALWGLAVIEAEEDPAAALALGGKLAEIWERTEERHYVVPIFRWFSTFYGLHEENERLNACAEALSRIASAVKTTEALASLAHALGEAALLQGDATRAVEHFERGLVLLENASLPFQYAQTMVRAAAAYAILGRNERAGEVLVAAQRIARDLDARPLAAMCAERLSELPHAATADSANITSLLTARQLEIAGLLVQGLTNKAIAKHLALSPRTIEMHVANILVALGCRSRTEAATKALELGLVEQT